jgi:hypothetical protein
MIGRKKKTIISGCINDKKKSFKHEKEKKKKSFKEKRKALRDKHKCSSYFSLPLSLHSQNNFI